MKKLAVSLALVIMFCCCASAQESSVKVLEEQKPLSIGLVVDNSASFRLQMDFVIAATQSLIGEMLPGDEAFLMRFVSAEKIDVLQELTSDRDVLSSTANEMYVEGGRTAIFTALREAANNLSGSGRNERKILILISDGESPDDKAVHTDVIKALKAGNIAVHIMGITASLENNIRETQRSMEKLAKETGGSVTWIERKTVPRDAAAAIMKAVRANSNNGK